MNARNSLGQSLKQMAEDKGNDSVSKRTIFQVDPLILTFAVGFNLRIDTPAFRESIQQLKESYIAGAVFPPVYVRKGTQEVVDGHRRTLAIRAAVAEGHPVRKIDVGEFEGNDAARVMHMLGTAEGRALSTLEQGIGYLRLIHMGWSKAEICKARVRSITHVEQALMLANANSDVQHLISHELVSVGAAIEALREHGEKAGDALKLLVSSAPTELDANGEERKKKVTKRTTKAARNPSSSRALPRKLSDRYVSGVAGLFSAMPQDLRVRIAVAIDDAMIPVSARYLKELLAAHAEAEEARGTEDPADEEDADARQASLLTEAA